MGLRPMSAAPVPTSGTKTESAGPAEFILRLRLEVIGPILIQAAEPGLFGVDAIAMRVMSGPARGKVCIPGTLLKGKLAEALAQLARHRPALQTFAREWLGVESHHGVEPERGRLWFGDCVAETAESPGQRHRIAIDQTLGSVREGMLQLAEMPFASGQSVIFVGEARMLGTLEQAESACTMLQLALHWVTQLGSNRTIGFGALRSGLVALEEGRRCQADSVVVPPGPGTAEKDSTGTAVAALELSFAPLGPLCIAKHKIGDNLFESSDLVPGNMIGGAVAETLHQLTGRSVTELASAEESEWSALARYFERLRFRFGFPTSTAAGVAVKMPARPQCVPLSVVAIPRDKPKRLEEPGAPAAQYRDLAMLNGPLVFSVSPGAIAADASAASTSANLVAPRFQTDWKRADSAAVDPQFGWAWPLRELRVRTAIDSIRRQAHRGDRQAPEPEGLLFAWEMVHPEDDGGRSLVWRSRIDLADIPVEDRPSVTNQLCRVLAVLSQLSKTKAPCQVVAQPAPALPSFALNSGDGVALVLQAPAMLIDPRFQCEPPQSGALDGEAMTTLYREVWKELSADSLELRHHYATQSLAGGNYLNSRFLQPRKLRYNPWLLTSAGSVFAFEVKDGEAAAKQIERWLNKGLELPQWAVQHYGCRWNENPFIPQNGYGEIALHQPHPATPVPGAEAVMLDVEDVGA
jgi:hypothetical protein